jgi:hypothetical protein
MEWVFINEANAIFESIEIIDRFARDLILTDRRYPAPTAIAPSN